MDVEPTASIEVQNTQHNYYDQRSLQYDVQNTQQNYYDQRNISVSVGADPQRVVEHVHAVESQAHSVVLETQRRAEQVVNETRHSAQQLVHDMQARQMQSQKDSELAVQRAQFHATTTEDRARQLIQDLTDRHQAELNRVQDIANQAQHQARPQLQEADARVQQLMALVDSQHSALENQRIEQQGLSAQVAALQNEVTMLRHSTSSPTHAQDLNGAVNQSELMSVIASLRQELRQSQAMRSQTMTTPPFGSVPIHTPPFDQMSACAGIAPGFPSSRSSGKKGPSKSEPDPFQWSALGSHVTATPPGPPGDESPSSSSSSARGHRWSGGSPGTPAGDPSGNGSHGGESPNRNMHSIGIGSEIVISEESVYRYKGLQSIKLDALPQDAGAYRGWKNGLITKLCSIDVTGRDIILGWVLEALDPGADLNASICMPLPRLDAHLAAVLTDPKHLKGDLGVQFQSYCEQCQQHHVSPKGRFMLQLIARRFQLDLNRGANLTQQSLLELQLDNYTQEGLSKFIQRIELVLNSIPPTHQPSEMTKFTWLFSRLKPCRIMQRFIDRIKDAREGSHVKTWDWLFDKLKRVVVEMREDANEEAVRRTLSPSKPKSDRPKGDGKGKEAKASVAKDTEDKPAKALPSPPKPKPKAKGNPKGGGKGKDIDQPKAAAAAKPTPKAKPKAEATATANRSSLACLFWPNGTCNRGDNCPFYHDPIYNSKNKPAAAKAKSSSSASGSASAKATVAILAAKEVSRASAADSNALSAPLKSKGCHSTSGSGGWNVLQASLRLIAKPFIALASLFSCIGQPQLSAHPAALLASPALVSSNHSVAMSARTTDSFSLEWIADSGAGRDLGSTRAFLEQGIPKDLVESCTQSAKPIKFETGNGTYVSDSCIEIPGSTFGNASFQVMDDCPLVRSLGKIVEEEGRPFVWIPGTRPYFGFNVDAVQVTADASSIVSATRVEDGVPIFSETFTMQPSYAAAAPVAAAPDALAPEVPASDAGSEDDAEEPVNRFRRLAIEAQSIEHKMSHLPKNPTCPICQRSRMYRKSVRRTRHDPLTDRGALPPVDQFGQRIATDFIIVQKLSSGKEHVVQVVRDEHSGWLRAFPLAKRDAATVVGNLLAFLGPAYDQPSVMVKSDQAPEVRSACRQLGFGFEGSLENRFPHNSVLERDVRTLEEISRANHLQAGFDIVPGLWVHSVEYSAAIITAMHKPAGKDNTRHFLATDTEFNGRKLLLGQLVHYRVDPLQRGKFDASTKPGLFCGYRYDSGPKSFKGVYFVLDYAKVKNKEPNYAKAIAVPLEELYVEESEPVLPLKNAADAALATFSDAALADITPLDVPFSSVSIETTAKRSEYITLDRIIRFGPTEGCRACRFEAPTSKHSNICRARFNGLIRAEKIPPSSSGKVPAPKTPAPVPETPSFAPLTPIPKLSDDKREVPDRVDPASASAGIPPDEHEVDPASFSAGIKPGEEDKEFIGMPAKANHVIDEEFLQSNANRRRYHRINSLEGQGTVFEYACSSTSTLGQIASSIGVECIRLSRDNIDLSNSTQVDQLIQQLDQRPGADAWISLPCTDYTPWQHMNVHRHGQAFEEKLHQRRKKSKKMFKLAKQFAVKILETGGRVAFEWPANSGWWDLPEVQAFEREHCFRRVYFHGCMLGVKGKELPIKKPWCVSTCDERLIQIFSQFICDGTHSHEPAEGSQTTQTGFYTTQFVTAILESWYPKQAFNYIPDVSSRNHACVTRNLTRAEWTRDERGLQAVQAEAAGLRANNTWCDKSVTTLSNLKAQSRTTGVSVKIASLLTLCGIKYWECSSDQWKYKGRIVYRGDLVRNESDEIILFEDTATSPTGLTALNVTLFYGMLLGHATSCADAVQAFLQAPLEEETWVILSEELWLPEWFKIFPRGTKLCVRLLKSLYGHPLAGKLWQEYLTQRLKAMKAVELEGFPSNFIIPRKDNKHLLLNIYVDDLTVSGDKSLHAEFWSELRSVIKIEPETYLDEKTSIRILGRTHRLKRTQKGTSLELDMRSYAAGIVEFYCGLCAIDAKSLKRVASPALPENLMTDQEDEEQGVLHGQAAKVLMRLLWLSRLSRPDLSFIVGRLASNTTRWSRWDDRQLLRVVSYLHSTSEFVTVAEVHYKCKPHIHVYTDADFASCPWSAKSTSGIIVCLVTGEAKWPIYWQSKKQSSVARSTSESELIAMSSALFGEVLQIQDMLHYLLGERPDVYFEQDNQAVIKIVENKYSVKLRHCGRVHRVNIASVSELLEDTEHQISLRYCHTQLQIANALTKILAPAHWPEALVQLQIRTASKT